MRARVILGILLFLGICNTSVNAQVNELRTLYKGSVHFDNQWKVSLDGGMYRGARDIDYLRWGIRGIVQKRYTPMVSFDAGFMYNYVDNYDNYSSEFRPHQTLHVTFPHLKRMSISHRLRLEERFTHSSSTGNNDFSSRFRYQISTKRALNFKKIIQPRVPYGILSAELNFSYTDYFVNDQPLVERGRYGLGVGMKFNVRTAFEVTYYYEHTHKSSSWRTHILNVQLIQDFY